MEQLPPLAHNWQMMPNSAAAAAPWMDDFLDFSATRRSLHRRTVSDPIAFAEDPPNNNTLFDRLDDDQLHNMFSDVAAVGSSSNPSSDQNSDNDDKITAPHIRPKTEPEPAPDAAPQPISSDDNIADPKRIKRILANRQSAQRSRVRKLHYISELERSVTTLQTEVSALSPRVAFLDHQRLMLSVDNSAIKQRIAALAQDRIFKDAHQEALKKEIERLREIYHKQNMRKTMENQGGDNAPPFTEEE